MFQLLHNPSFYIPMVRVHDTAMDRKNLANMHRRTLHLVVLMLQQVAMLGSVDYPCHRKCSHLVSSFDYCYRAVHHHSCLVRVVLYRVLRGVPRIKGLYR